MSKATWTILVSAFFTVVTSYTPIPERWKPLIVSASWMALIFSCLGWTLSHFQSTGRWRSASSPATLVIVGCVGAVLAIGIWLVAHSQNVAPEDATTSPPVDSFRPEFDVRFGGSINTYVPEKDQTMMFIGTQILNRGESSAVVFRRAHYKSPSLDSDVNMLNMSQPRAILFPGENKTLVMKHSDVIQAKCINGLAKGQAVTGRLALGIPGNRVQEIANGVSVAFEIEDYTGKVYSSVFATDPSRIPSKLLIAPDEEVRDGMTDLSFPRRSTEHGKSSIKFSAYLQPEEPYAEGTTLGGILWSKQYVDVRLDVKSGESAIQNLDLRVGLDTSIAQIGQLTQIPGIVAFPSDSPPAVWLQGTDAAGKPISVPMSPAPGMMNGAPIYRIQCPSFFANTDIHFVIASVALNPVDPKGGLPKTLFAPRRVPKIIQIKGSYETVHGGNSEGHTVEFSYLLPDRPR